MAYKGKSSLVIVGSHEFNDQALRSTLLACCLRMMCAQLHMSHCIDCFVCASCLCCSDVLESQVRRLQPHLHLYGHTHIPLGTLRCDLPVNNCYSYYFASPLMGRASAVLVDVMKGHSPAVDDFQMYLHSHCLPNYSNHRFRAGRYTIPAVATGVLQRGQPAVCAYPQHRTTARA